MENNNYQLGLVSISFRNHTPREILEAVREGEIAPSRHASYVEIYDTLKQKKKWS